MYNQIASFGSTIYGFHRCRTTSKLTSKINCVHLKYHGLRLTLGWHIRRRWKTHSACSACCSSLLSVVVKWVIATPYTQYKNIHAHAKKNVISEWHRISTIDFANFRCNTWFASEREKLCWQCFLWSFTISNWKWIHGIRKSYVIKPKQRSV